jgi:hypothetical protein
MTRKTSLINQVIGDAGKYPISKHQQDKRYLPASPIDLTEESQSYNSRIIGLKLLFFNTELFRNIFNFLMCTCCYESNIIDLTLYNCIY